MAVKSESVLINQNLKLAFRAALVALAFFWARSSSFSFLAVISFTALFTIFYFRPIFNAGRFSVSALTLFFLVFLIPPLASVSLEVYLTLMWGALFFTTLGVKNLVLLKRKGGYELVHSSLVFAMTALYFAGSLPQVLLFIALFFLLREFYLGIDALSDFLPRLVLAAAIIALILVEAGWLLTFVPVSPILGAGLITLSAFLLHDTLTHYLKGTLGRELILRNITIFFLVAILIVALPI
ncbi:MAG: hypothetical protein HYS89_01235 [Candidatus Colwellbacteria bacterium]|nr:hypothetical protein [Candidatus Colwellbacteria bacterium]